MRMWDKQKRERHGKWLRVFNVEVGVYIPRDYQLNMLRIHSSPSTKCSLEQPQRCHSLKTALVPVSPAQSLLRRHSSKESLFLLFQSRTEPPEVQSPEWLGRFYSKSVAQLGGREEPRLMGQSRPQMLTAIVCHCSTEDILEPGASHSCLLHMQPAVFI